MIKGLIWEVTTISLVKLIINLIPELVALDNYDNKSHTRLWICTHSCLESQNFSLIIIKI